MNPALTAEEIRENVLIAIRFGELPILGMTQLAHQVITDETNDGKIATYLREIMPRITVQEHVDEYPLGWWKLTITPSGRTRYASPDSSVSSILRSFTDDYQDIGIQYHYLHNRVGGNVIPQRLNHREYMETLEYLGGRLWTCVETTPYGDHHVFALTTRDDMHVMYYRFSAESMKQSAFPREEVISNIRNLMADSELHYSPAPDRR